MDINLFRTVFNNKLLKKYIFNNVHQIFANKLKEYYLIKVYTNNSDDLNIQIQTVLLNAFKSECLGIIKFIIEELLYYYKSLGCFDRYHRLHFKGQDLLYIATYFGNFEIIQYIESLQNNNPNSRYGNGEYTEIIQYLESLQSNNNHNWDYIESFKVSPLSNDIKVVQFLYKKIIENHIIIPNKQIIKAILNALSIGRIDFAEWIVAMSKTKDVKDIHYDENLNSKSENGYLDIFKWLHDNNFGGAETDRAITTAALNGDLEIIKLLHEYRVKDSAFTFDSEDVGFSFNTMDSVASNGNLEIIKWLHFNRTDGCTTDAMDNAAMNGHIEILKWLHENRTEGCTTFAMNFAAENGHLETIKWLHENRSEGCTSWAIEKAAFNGHFEIVKWLHGNRTEGSIINAMNNAKKNGYPEISKWLLENKKN